MLTERIKTKFSNINLDTSIFLKKFCEKSFCKTFVSYFKLWIFKCCILESWSPQCLANQHTFRLDLIISYYILSRIINTSSQTNIHPRISHRMASFMSGRVKLLPNP